MKRRKEEDSSSYGGYKLLLSKDWFKVVRVNCDIASISSFRIDIPPSSESVWFGAKISRTELDAEKSTQITMLASRPIPW